MNVTLLLFLIVVVACMWSFTTGVMVIFSALIDKGVFSSACDGTGHGNSTLQPTTTTTNTGCRAQEERLEQATVVVYTAANIGCSIVGALVDVLGVRKGTIGILLIWTAATAMSGLLPHLGVMWLVGQCIALSCSVAILLPVQAYYASGVFPGDRAKAPVVQSVSAIGIQGGACLGLLFREVIVAPGMTIELAYLVAAAAVGLPLVLGFVYAYQRDHEGYPVLPSVSNVSLEKDAGRCTGLPQDQLSFLDSSRSAYEITRTHVWRANLCVACCAIALGHVCFANIASIGRYHALSRAEIETMRHQTWWLVAIGGAFVVVTGLSAWWRGVHRCLVEIPIIRMAMCIMVGGLIMWRRGGVVSMYAIVLIFSAWREMAFAMVAVVHCNVFRGLPGLNQSFTWMSSIGAVVCIILGLSMTVAMQAHSSMVPVFGALFIVIGGLSELYLSWACSKWDPVESGLTAAPLIARQELKAGQPAAAPAAYGGAS